MASGAAEHRSCLGVYQCEGCGRLSRPKSDVHAREKQLAAACTQCRERLTKYPCAAQFFRYTRPRNGVEYRVWEHQGHHPHAKPPGGRVSQHEEDAIDQQVLRRHDANAHQLRTGDLGPGSVPLADIAPSLANPRAARYELSKSHERLGLSTPSRGAFGLLDGLKELGELDPPFLVNSGIHGPIFIILQTPFMAKIISEVTQHWIEDTGHGQDHGRHGFVTDGDHSFFRRGQLLVSCAFSTVTCTWLPVLYTFVYGLDIPHHQPHFRQLFTDVAHTAGHRLEPKHLLHVRFKLAQIICNSPNQQVMDFSASQQGAHTEAYVDVATSMNPGFLTLSKAAQDAERQALREESLQAQRGCEVHFWRSATRLKANGSLVPADEVNTFDRLLRILLSSHTSLTDFNITVASLHVDFPQLKAWLAWWLRARVAAILFPVKMAVDTDTVMEVPSTSNAVEQQHSLLHHASGIDHDLVAGIRNLHLHVVELEKHYNAIQGEYSCFLLR